MGASARRPARGEGLTAPREGLLVVVATPIGNLGDLSSRAVDALREADVVVCEDTRRTRALLSHAGVTGKQLVAFPVHREAAGVARLLGWLDEGKAVALVSDAGTPAVSDPGARMVSAAAAGGYPVEAVPGPSALLAALVVSGLPTDRFCFEGFLPRKGPERRARLAAIAAEERTTVLFDSPLRVAATLADLAAACGAARAVAVARELTKLHEEVWRGEVGEAAALAAAAEVRGEHVIVLAGRPPAEPVGDDSLQAALGEQIAAGLSARDAARVVAEELSVGRRRAYEAALRLRSARGEV